MSHDFRRTRNQNIRRDLTISSVLRGLLLGGMTAAAIVGAANGVGNYVMVLLIGLSMAWAFFSLKAARRSFHNADSPSLIASGQFAEAEEQIEKEIKSFFQFKSVKLGRRAASSGGASPCTTTMARVGPALAGAAAAAVEHDACRRPAPRG